MKKFFLATAILFSTSSVFAGAVKEIWSTTNESVLEVLGFDESIVSLEQKFAQVEGFDLAVKTTVRGHYKVKGVVPTFECITVYKKNLNNYDLVKTECQKVQ
jgi:hypothetical protein